MNNHTLPSRTSFWIIILSAVLITVIMCAFSITYQIHEREVKATIAAAPTVTTEFLEFHYQKGAGYININRWHDAKKEMELVFEIDPDYGDVQERLVEIYTKIEQLRPFASPTGQHTSDMPTKTPYLLTPPPSPVTLPSENGYQLVEQDVLYLGEQRIWSFDASSEDIILLSMEARIDWHKLAGSANILELTVNEKPVTSELLVNKPITYTFADGRRYVYYKPVYEGGDFYCWEVFYSPDYESNNVWGSRYQVLEGQAYLYIFDITHLVWPSQLNKIILSTRGEHIQHTNNRVVPLTIRQVKLLKNREIR